jgi:hypothetical protein
MRRSAGKQTAGCAERPARGDGSLFRTHTTAADSACSVPWPGPGPARSGRISPRRSRPVSCRRPPCQQARPWPRGSSRVRGTAGYHRGDAADSFPPRATRARVSPDARACTCGCRRRWSRSAAAAAAAAAAVTAAVSLSSCLEEAISSTAVPRCPRPLRVVVPLVRPVGPRPLLRPCVWYRCKGKVACELHRGLPS